MDGSGGRPDESRDLCGRCPGVVSPQVSGEGHLPPCGQRERVHEWASRPFLPCPGDHPHPRALLSHPPEDVLVSEGCTRRGALLRRRESNSCRPSVSWMYRRGCLPPLGRSQRWLQVRLLPEKSSYLPCNSRSSGGSAAEIGEIGGSLRPSCRDLEPLLAVVGRIRTSAVAERKRKRRERVLS